MAVGNPEKKSEANSLKKTNKGNAMLNVIPQIIILVFSIIFHEVAHGRVALWRGDTTARDAGRLTLNPLPHIDIFGTILSILFVLRK